MTTHNEPPVPGWDGKPGRVRNTRWDGDAAWQAGAIPPAGREAMRIGDVERDAAAAELGDHYVAGRLTLDELNERLSGVFAVKTHGQLSRLMADLPRLRQRRASRPTDLASAPHPECGRGGHAVADHAARLAALALLLAAMLIWLLTAMLFIRHGYAHPQQPPPWIRYPTGP